MPCFALLSLSALAGAPAGFTSGVEGQRGYGPPVASADGRELALTRWDRAGLWVLDLDTGALSAVSAARGAGFHPVWDGDALLFKAVDTGDQPTQGAFRWRGGALETLDEGGHVGQPEALSPGRAMWVRGEELLAQSGGRTTRIALPGDVDLVEPDPGGARIAWDDDVGRLWVRSLSTGETRPLSAAGLGSHPLWSGDGGLLVQHETGDVLNVVDPATGALRASADGRDPAWIPGTHTLVYARVETGEDEDQSPYMVRASSLWALDADTGVATPILDDGAIHPRYPTPLGDTGALAFVDSRQGDLWTLEDGVVRRLSTGAHHRDTPPPPPDYPYTSVWVPYMHQLWDTPDDFNGNWSCGPTSCTQVIGTWSILPDATITCSWPYSHSSAWGWYIPNAYSFNGYTYDTWGEAAGGSCQGSHGFICREYGGAVWSYMVDFMNQHGVASAEVGTSYDSVISEINAGYPLYASVYVLGYGHILVIRGYMTDGGSPIHSIIVNDPYGNAGSGDWGNYDGEGIAYDWPGYNNGHLEIEVKELFTAHGSTPPSSSDPGTSTPVDTGTAPAPADTGTASESAPVGDSATTSTTTGQPDPGDPDPLAPPPGGRTLVSDLSGCATGGGAKGWMAALFGLLLLRRRAQPK